MKSIEQIKQFYATIGTFSNDFHPSHHLVTQYIADLHPKSVFEFGAAWGKNNVLIQKLDSTIQYCGMDVNPDHIGIAKHEGQDVTVGDERTLQIIPDDTFDVTFTSSVLTHIPPKNITQVVGELKRITKNTVIACESIDWHESWSHTKPRAWDSTKIMWYTHDYLKLGYRDTKEYAWNALPAAYYHLFVM